MTHPLDKQNMEEVIRQSPRQFTAGLNAVKSSSLPKRAFRRVLVAGMGGSAMPAAVVDEAGLAIVPIRTHQSYGLPAGLDRSDTLVIASSFSGNTEETLAAYDDARRAGFAIVGISAGGALEQRCAADQVPFVRIPADPPNMQPRAATGYGVGILVGLLDGLGLANEGAVAALEQLPAFLAAQMDQARQVAKSLIAAIRAATPVVYASHRYANVARIWKIKFNENAKTPAFWNVFPELNHNEMTGWIRRHGPFHLILLSDPAEDPRIRLREDTTRQLLETTCNVTVTRILMPGETTIEKMFATLLIGDWTSYELALELGEDPSPVHLVEEFKGLLKEQSESSK